MIRKLPLELILWLLALILLWNLDLNAMHGSLCPMAVAGLDWCPGCGLGRSISLFLHGNFKESVEMHWFGIPAFLILLSRIYVLTRARFDLKRFTLKNI